MNHLYRIIIIALLGIVILCGCSQTKTNTKSDPLPVASGSVSKTSGTGWQMNTPNALLNYVPNDASLVFATQRNRDIHSKGVLEYLSTASIVLYYELDKNVRNLLKYYEAIAPLIGLDQNGRLDAVIYIHDNKLVFQITVSDEKKLKDALDNLTNELRSDNVNVWRKQNWTFYDIKEHGHDYSVATNMQNNIFTVVLSAMTDTIPDEVLSVRKNHFEPKAISQDTVLAGYIDYEKMIDFIFSLPVLTDDIDRQNMLEIMRRTDLYNRDEYYNTDNYTEWLKAHGLPSITDEACIHDFKTMFSSISSSNLTLSLSDSGAAGFQFNIDIKSSDLLRDLNDLKTEHADLDDSNAVLSGYVSLSMDKALKLIQNIMLPHRDWKCPYAEAFINEIVDEFDIDKWNADNEYTQDIRGFESISFVLNDLYIDRLKRTLPTPRLLIHMKNTAPNAFMHISDHLDIHYKDSFMTSVKLEGYEYNVLFRGSDAYLGTISPDQNLQHRMIKDHFADLKVKKSFIYALVADEMSHAPVPLYLMWNYHLIFTIENNSLVFSILPYED